MRSFCVRFTVRFHRLRVDVKRRTSDRLRMTSTIRYVSLKYLVLLAVSLTNQDVLAQT